MTMDDPLSGLRGQLVTLWESEELFARQVEFQREAVSFDRQSAQSIADRLGWSDTVYDLIASRAKALAAAESSLAAAAALRQATERLIAELESDEA